MSAAPLRTLGLYGANFTRFDQFVLGLKATLPGVRFLWLDSGPLAPYLELCDAYLWLHDEGRDQIPLALQTGKPVLGRSVPFVGLGVPIVHMDDETPARQLAEHMITQGARAIFYWGMPRLFSERRANGARAAAKSAGLPFTECQSLAELLAALRAAPHPAGLVCMNDERAFAVSEALHGTGLTVGREVLVSGFDNDALPEAPWAVPVSTVVLPIEPQGRLAGQLIAAAAAGTPIPLAIHTAPPAQLLLRSSTTGATRPLA
jgi:DNA-binding LacI/PurR family transcriptional regulator